MMKNHHYNIKAYLLGQECQRLQEILQWCFEANHMDIKVNLNPLEATILLSYLGLTITYNNSGWAALYSNLRKAYRRWGAVVKVLENTGAPIKAHAMMYKAVVQAVLLYGCRIWVVKGEMMTVLEILSTGLIDGLQDCQQGMATVGNESGNRWMRHLRPLGFDR